MFDSLAKDPRLSLLLPPALAFVVTLLFLYRFRSIALRIGLLDDGGPRKGSYPAVPVIGGAAMMIGICIGLLFAEPSLRHITLKVLLAASAFMAFVGLMDDLKEFNSLTKLACQIIAAVTIVVLGETNITNLGNLFGNGNIDLGAYSEIFTIICIVGVMNAVNMVDGMDGLAGGLCLVAFGVLAVSCYRHQREAELSILLIIMAVLLAFLWFNVPHPFRPKVKVFMGDCGALLLGTLLVWMAIHLSQATPKSEALLKPIAMVWVLGVFLLDMFATIFYRLYKGRNPLSADNDHLHHRLKAIGYSGPLAGTFMLVLGAAFALIGVTQFAQMLSEAQLFLLALLLLPLTLFILYLNKKLGQ